MAYQSFGSYGSFKFTPDLGRSRKILEARSEERDGEDRYLNQLQQQQRSYMDVMRQKLRDEQAQRDRNFQIEGQFRQQYQDSVNKNEETKIANLQVQRQQSADFMKSLSDFSQTLGKKFVAKAQADEKKAADKERFEYRFKLENSTDEELIEIYGLQAVREAQLQGSDSALNAIANTQEPFVGSNEVEPVRQSAYGSLTVNEQRAYLSFLGANLGKIADLNSDFKYTLSVDGEPTELTLNEAKQQGGEVAAQAFQAFKEETIKQLGLDKGEVSAEFLVRNFSQPASNFITRELAESETKRAENLKQIAELNASKAIRDKVITGISNQFDPASPYIVSELTSQYAAENNIKDLGYIRDSIILPEIEDMVKSGAFDDNLAAIPAFLNRQLLVINESGKPVPLQSIKSSDALDELNLTIKERQRKQEGAREQEYKAAALDDVNRLHGAALEDGVVTPTEKHKIKQSMFAAYKHDPATLKAVYDAIDNFGLDDSENLDKESEYLSMVTEGKNGTLTALKVQQNLNWLSKEQREELTNYVDAFNSEDPEKEGFKRKDIEKKGGLILRSALDELDIGRSVDVSVLYAETEIGDYYVGEYNRCRADGGDDKYCAESSAIVTYEYVKGGVTDPSNDFYVVTADKAEGTQGYIKGFQLGEATVAQQTNTRQQLSDITRDPSLLSTDVYLSNRYLADIKSDIKNGRMIEYTPIVNQIAAITNQMPYEVINQQLAAAKIDQKIEPGAFDKLVEVAAVSPKLKAMLAEPTAARINTAIIGTNNVPKTVRPGKDGEQDVMQLAYRADFKAPALAAAMWKLDTANGNTVLGSNRLFNLNNSGDEQGYLSVFEAAKAATTSANNIPGFQSATTYAEAAQAIARSAYPNDPKYANKLMSELADMGYRPDEQIRVHTGPPAVNPAFMSPTLRRSYYRQLDSNQMASNQMASNQMASNQMASNTQSGFDISTFNTRESYGGVSLDRLRDAVIMKESSGSHLESDGTPRKNKHTNATGLGQIMPGNIKKWSKDALGKSISQEEFENSPELQMRIINHRFTKMMKEQSALGFTGRELIRRVASIWYSGKPHLLNNTNSQDIGDTKYDSIKNYTENVADRYSNN